MLNGDHIRWEVGTSFQNARQIINLISIREEIHFKKCTLIGKLEMMKEAME